MPEPLETALRRPQGEMWKGRLEEAAEEATARARGSLGSDAEVTCNYGGAVGGGELKKTAMVQLTWRAVGIGDRSEEHTLDVRCDHACDQGSPLPDTWRAAVRCIGLPAKAAAAAKMAQKDMALDAVYCVWLGQPQSSPLSGPTIARVPGARVHLLHEVAAQDFLLAAHVDADRWFCHGGGPEADPFNDMASA